MPDSEFTIQYVNQNITDFNTSISGSFKVATSNNGAQSIYGEPASEEVTIVGAQLLFIGTVNNGGGTTSLVLTITGPESPTVTSIASASGTIIAVTAYLKTTGNYTYTLTVTGGTTPTLTVPLGMMGDIIAFPVIGLTTATAYISTVFSSGWTVYTQSQGLFPANTILTAMGKVLLTNTGAPPSASQGYSFAGWVGVGRIQTGILSIIESQGGSNVATNLLNADIIITPLVLGGASQSQIALNSATLLPGVVGVELVEGSPILIQPAVTATKAVGVVSNVRYNSIINYPNLPSRGKSYITPSVPIQPRFK